MTGWRYYTDAGVVEIASENVKDHSYIFEDNKTRFEMNDGSIYIIYLDKVSYCFYGELCDD